MKLYAFTTIMLLNQIPHKSLVSTSSKIWYTSCIKVITNVTLHVSLVKLLGSIHLTQPHLHSKFSVLSERLGRFDIKHDVVIPWDLSSLTWYRDWPACTSFPIGQPSFDFSSSNMHNSGVLSEWLTKNIRALWNVGIQINSYKLFSPNLLPQTWGITNIHIIYVLLVERKSRHSHLEDAPPTTEASRIILNGLYHIPLPSIVDRHPQIWRVFWSFVDFFVYSVVIKIVEFF